MELIALMNYFQAIVSVDTSICHIAANLECAVTGDVQRQQFQLLALVSLFQARLDCTFTGLEEC